MTTPVPWSMKKLLPICARMDVDPRCRVGDFGNHPRDEWEPQLVQRVREPVVDDGRDARVAGEHFVDAPRGRVAFVGGQNVGLEQPANLRQAAGEIANQLLRLASARARVGLFAHKLQLERHLFDEVAARIVERVADVIVDAFVRQLPRAEPIGKEHRAQPLDDRVERFARRELERVRRAAPRSQRRVPQLAQLGDDGLHCAINGGRRRRGLRDRFCR